MEGVAEHQDTKQHGLGGSVLPNQPAPWVLTQRPPSLSLCCFGGCGEAPQVPSCLQRAGLVGFSSLLPIRQVEVGRVMGQTAGAVSGSLPGPLDTEPTARPPASTLPLSPVPGVQGLLTGEPSPDAGGMTLFPGISNLLAALSVSKVTSS